MQAFQGSSMRGLLSHLPAPRPGEIDNTMKLKQKFSLSLLLATLVLQCALLSAARAATDTTGAPRPLLEALSKYKKEGINAFINTLVSGSPLEGHQEIRQQVLVLEQLKGYYGSYQSFDILHANRLSSSTEIVYFLLNYEKGPVFGKLTVFNDGERETITSFRFHTKPEEIFPDALLMGQ